MARDYGLDRLKWQPRDGRTRVFIEDADPDRYRIAARALADAGFQVGPFCGGTHFHDAVFEDGAVPICPLIKKGECTLVEEAEVIVFRFGLESPKNRLVLDLIRHARPETPVILEATKDEEAQLRPLPEGFHIVPAPAALDDLVRAVVAAAA